MLVAVGVRKTKKGIDKSIPLVSKNGVEALTSKGLYSHNARGGGGAENKKKE